MEEHGVTQQNKFVALAEEVDEGEIATQKASGIPIDSFDSSRVGEAVDEMVRQRSEGLMGFPMDSFDSSRAHAEMDEMVASRYIVRVEVCV